MTGPGINNPIQRDIDIVTGRTTVDIPVGNNRVFEVQAFPAGLPIANFIGRTTANVAPTGTNVGVNMQAVTLNSIQLTPPNPQIARGTLQQLTATGLFSDGSVQGLTSLVNWVSSNTDVAVVSNGEGLQGLATGVQVGNTQIRATLLNVTGATTLTVTAAEVAAITITPAISSVAIGTNIQFIATGVFTDGSSQDLTPSATWASSSADIATITASGGLATGRAEGTTTISASFDGVTGSTTLSVSAAQLAAITITPAAPTIALGTRLQFIATGVFTDSSSQDLTPSATWASSSADIATITASGGLATAVTEGTTTISASFDGIIGSAVLTVSAAQLLQITLTPVNPTIADGTTVPFTATGLFTNGLSQNLTVDAIWTSSDENVATISNAAGSRGLTSAVAAGTTIISASFGGVTGSTTLTVSAAQLVQITLTPVNPTIADGTTVPFTATGLFTDGLAQNLTTLATWTSSAPNVATISNAAGSRGLASAVAAGTTTITATFQGLGGSTVLTVSAAQLLQITLTPVNPIIADGTTVPFTATGLFTEGPPQNLTTLATWTSSAPNVATISNAAGSRGLATAVAAGTTSISASFGGVTGNTLLTVTAAQLVQITLTPVSPIIADGTTVPFTATGLFTEGPPQNLTTLATWISSDETVATISNAAGSRGLATAVAAGTTSISASFGGVTGNTLLTVTAARLLQITVTPVNPIIADGTTLPFTATGLFTEGPPQNLTATATWTSSDETVATISNAAGSRGLATAVAAGTTIISASFGGVAGSTLLTVTAAQLLQITLTPVNPTIADGSTVSFTATGLFTEGPPQNVTATAAWASSDEAVATISNAAGSQGLATAVAAGTTIISASFGGVSGNTLLTVTAAQLLQITLTPINPVIADGTTVPFTATGLFTEGPPQNLTANATWTSSDETVATISNAAGSQGLATAVAAGTTIISASFGGVSGNTLLTVTAAQLLQITLTPINPVIADGTTVPFTATGLFTEGPPQNLTANATWTSSDPAVATISNAAGSQGLATAVAAGTTIISASFGGVSGNTLLTVTAAQLLQITLTPINPVIADGTTVPFTATGLFTEGPPQNLTANATWTSSDPAVATISNAAGSQGLATAVAAGTTIISASFDGLTGSTLLTVSAAQLAAIIVTPADATIADGTSLQFTATGIFTDSSIQDLTNLATWDAFDSDLCSIVPNTGLATALGVGTCSITATFQDVVGSTTLTVRQVEVAAIVVTPAGPAIALGTTLQFTATGFSEDGFTQDLTAAVVWESSDPSIASINAQGGLATALALGDTNITATFDGTSGTTTLSVEDGADLVAVPLPGVPGPNAFCNIASVANQLLITVQNQGSINASSTSTTRVVFLPGGTFDIATPAIAEGTSVTLRGGFSPGVLRYRWRL